MSAALRAFDFESTPVRTIDRAGDPWFVGKDVCTALDIKNHKDALARLDADERDGVGITDPIGRQQTITMISEPGVYRLTFTSRTEAAERFKRWLAHEVLPALRREGRYQIERTTPDEEAEDDDLPMNADQKIWGVKLQKVRAAAAMISVVARIYGPEAARKLYEAEPSLPDVKDRTIAALAGTELDDATGCLMQLLRFKVSDSTSFGALLKLAFTDKMMRGDAARNGVIVEPSGHREHVLVASKHKYLQRVYAGTPWRKDWRFALLGLNGAQMLDGMRRFGGENSGGVLIPFATVQDAFLKGAAVAPPPG
jgi:prophage antirepressor-like protein